MLCDTPTKPPITGASISRPPYFAPEYECLAVLLLNTRRCVKGHQLVTLGTQDTLLISPSQIYRLAIATSASAIIAMHNHPSGVIPHPVLCRMQVGLPFETHHLSVRVRHYSHNAWCSGGDGSPTRCESCLIV